MDGFKAIRRVLWITLGLNLLATLAKLIVGYLTGSLSLIADGVDSVFDAASNVIGLVGIHFAAKPADSDHPYGHRKAETMTALIIAGLLFLTTWELLQSAIERLRNPALVQAEVNIWSFGALLVSIVVHITVVVYELRAGRRLHSDVLVADAMHTRADIFVSLSVVAGLIAVRLGYPLADPIMALVISLVIAKIGIDILRENVPTLMDRLVMPVEEVSRIALTVPDVVSCHRVRSRGHDQDVYADLHIRVDPELSTERAHDVAHEVQRRLRDYRPELRDVTIHVEPSGLAHEAGDWESGESVARQVRQLAAELGIAIHGISMHEVDGRYHMALDLEADGKLPLREAHKIASSLEERARSEIASLVELTSHIEPAGLLSRAGARSDQSLDEQAVSQLVEQVTGRTMGADVCHRIQVMETEDGWDVSMHCHLPDEMPLTDAHRLSSELESSLREKVPHLERVVVHTEPRPL